MHELGLALEIVELATRSIERASPKAGATGGARVTRVVVEVGKLAVVLPDALRFCWELAIDDTPLAGARLEIVEVPGRGRCRACAVELELAGPLGRCACGSTDLDWIGGDDLILKQLEVA